MVTLACTTIKPYLHNEEYRKLYNALHTWNWPLSAPNVTSTEVFWGREVLPHQIWRCTAVRLDRIQGYGHLERERGSILRFTLSILFIECCWQGVERRSPAMIIYDPWWRGKMKDTITMGIRNTWQGSMMRRDRTVHSSSRYVCNPISINECNHRFILR